MYKINILLGLLYLNFISCDNPIFNKTLNDIDITPPVIEKIKSINSKTMEIITDEECFINEREISISPNCGKIEIEKNINTILIHLENEQDKGKKYLLEGIIKDLSNNSNQFIFEYYAINPDLPELIINEFITNGSTNHPDMVEIYVKSKGNITGACIYEGTRIYFDDIFIFPDLNVNEGDYIIVHFKPQNIPEEINETNSKNESGGLDSHPEAWDFWVKNGNGISGNNGTLCIYNNPYEEIIDAVIYSNRTSSSDEKYRGFGSTKNMNNADEVHNKKQWDSQDELLKPEDTINPTGSTSTRSICRNARSTDSNKKNDWHIVPTRGSSFGTKNTEDIYVK